MALVITSAAVLLQVTEYTDQFEKEPHVLPMMHLHWIVLAGFWRVCRPNLWLSLLLIITAALTGIQCFSTLMLSLTAMAAMHVIREYDSR